MCVLKLRLDSKPIISMLLETSCYYYAYNNIWAYKRWLMFLNSELLLTIRTQQGLVIEQLQASASEGVERRFIFVGDGRGDFCPSLKLGRGDYVMPRKDYPLWNRICDDPKLVNATVLEWSDGEEMETLLLHLIHTLSTEDDSCNGAANLQPWSKSSPLPSSLSWC